MGKDYYKILKVARDADDNGLKKAYRKVPGAESSGE